MIGAFRKGARWSDLGGDMVETRDVTGLIVLEGPAAGSATPTTFIASHRRVSFTRR